MLVNHWEILGSRLAHQWGIQLPVNHWEILG